MATTKKAAASVKATPASKPSATPAPKARGMEKKFLKTRPVCKVTFNLPKEAAPDAQSVCIMGEFNNWSREATPLKRRADGDYFVTLDLDIGRSYRFRYIIDGCKFENDWHADRYEPNPHGGDDSVVDV